MEDEDDRARQGLRYTIQVTGDSSRPKDNQFPSAQFCNRQVGRLTKLYLDPREVMGETTTVKDGVTHLRFAPIAATFVPDIPPGVIRTDATIPAELPKSAGLEEFPPNAIPLLLGTVRFMFKGKSTGAGVEVQRQNIPSTGITIHAAQGANTAKTVVHFCLRM